MFPNTKQPTLPATNRLQLVSVSRPLGSYFISSCLTPTSTFAPELELGDPRHDLVPCTSLTGSSGGDLSGRGRGEAKGAGE